MPWGTMTWSDVARGIALAGLLLLGGCSREPAGFLLLPLVQAKSYSLDASDSSGDGLSFPKAPEVRAVEVGHERRPAVLTTPGRWRWRGRVPEGARLHVGLQALPQAWAAARALEAEVVVRDGGRREILEVARATAKEDRAWIDFDADLRRYAGRDVTLELSASLVGLPADRRSANLIAWGPVNIANGPEEDRTNREEERRPNILFILVDTLRHDHLTPYGYRRDTSPEIARRLAARGTVVEDAYSQAPWTLPSVVSFMTGRYPGELLGADLATYGVPEGVPTLAEMLSALGYETGGFIANPTLHAGAGFGRGFRTFHAPPAEVSWMLDKHADDLNARVLPWLSAYQNQERPFFLYVHYIDPHDPYMNPDMVDGYKSPFMPEYKGPIAGDWVHGIYGGKLQLGDPEADVAHIRALYDNEIRYVDRHIGQLLAAIDPKVLANTLIVLTSDHGEELYDHGGWKHGQTLYEEQIHVPLIVRWDGHVPAGKRLGGAVSLLDLVPTLMMAAAGGKDVRPDPAWQGIDLLPALTGGKPLPRRSVFSQHLSGGPLRAAAIMDRQKLLLFNSREPFDAEDSLQSYLLQKDLQRPGTSPTPGRMEWRGWPRPSTAGSAASCPASGWSRALPARAEDREQPAASPSRSRPRAGCPTSWGRTTASSSTATASASSSLPTASRRGSGWRGTSARCSLWKRRPARCGSATPDGSIPVALSGD